MSNSPHISEQVIHLNVEGMTCANCALGIKKYLEKEGLEDVDVSFATNDIEFKPKADVDLDKIKKGIDKLGYKVVDDKKPGDKQTFSFSKIELRFLISLPFSLLLLSAMFVPVDLLHNPYFQLVMAIPVYLIGLEIFGKSAISSLKTGVPNMDVLVIMGASAAFFYSLVGTIWQLGPTFQFYETAAMIITLLLLGNIIEERSVKQTTTAIDELARLQPEKAKLIVSENGKEKTVEIDTTDISVGQKLLVNTGDKIPVDGKILSGKATISEAAITGESVPVFKEEDDDIIGGTVVEVGNFVMEATATGKNTVLSRIIDLVKKARGAKPPIQRLADRISAIFVPVVVSIAIVTFLVAFFAFDVNLSKAVLNSVAVLVIACPCAMGLATPTAVMVGIGKAAKSGILIKGGETIETLNQVKNIVFDKTGTLTTGNFDIENLEILDGSLEKQEVQRILGSLESRSSHPIAKSIAEKLKKEAPFEWKSTAEKKGVGVKGTDNEGNEWFAGSHRILKDSSAKEDYDVFLTKNGLLVAGLAIKDEIKEEAKNAIDKLHEKGYKTILLSGDKEKKCAQVANALGIDEYYSEQLPNEKLDRIDEIKKSGKTAMVGDGINDAPALTQADIGISLSNATQIAIQSAEVILLNGHLSRLPQALTVSKKTVVTIRQNLFWAFFYNVLAIPIAAIGMLSPMIAAISMSLSDVVVVGNSIRLRLRK